MRARFVGLFAFGWTLVPAAACNALIGTQPIVYEDAGASLVPTEAGEGAADGSPCELGAGYLEGERATCTSFIETWECQGEQRVITCSCPAGSCTCGTKTSPHDCTMGCAATVSDYERCGIYPLPAPIARAKREAGSDAAGDADAAAADGAP